MKLLNIHLVRLNFNNMNIVVLILKNFEGKSIYIKKYYNEFLIL